jgi:hypothetical protein
MPRAHGCAGAVTFAGPPHSSQVVISIPRRPIDTRLRRCAFMPSGAGHRGVTVCRLAVARLTVFLTLVAFAAFSRCYQYPQGIKARYLLFG